MALPTGSGLAVGGVPIAKLSVTVANSDGRS